MFSTSAGLQRQREENTAITRAVGIFRAPRPEEHDLWPCDPLSTVLAKTDSGPAALEHSRGIQGTKEAKEKWRSSCMNGKRGSNRELFFSD